MRKELNPLGRVLGHLLGLLVGLLLAASAWGQAGTNSGVIAGEVTDSSGAKVSGARVEIASPALIERIRDTVTGDDGLYKIVNVPSGVYTVTASQTGFNNVERSGVDVTTGFTATVNFTLTPGSITQTISVSGEAPVLDTEDSVVQKVISNAVMASLPLGKSAADYPSLVPGAIGAAGTQDVGGLTGENNQGFRINGSASGDYMILRDGMFFGSNGGGNRMTSNNPTATQEMQIETSGYSAEDWTAAGHVNIIPKNGGNNLHGSFQADYSNKVLQPSNVTQEDQNLGVPQASSIRSLYEVAGGVGGPILKDKVWFFFDARHWVSASTLAGSQYFFDANETAPFPNDLYYAANHSEPAYTSNTYTDEGLRLSWQATKRNQFTENFIQQQICNCYYQIINGNLAPEAATHHPYKPDWDGQATWTFAANNKLVLWAGFTAVVGSIVGQPSGEGPNNILVEDNSHTFNYGATGTAESIANTIGNYHFINTNENFTASYVTGPHSFKFGYTEYQGRLTSLLQFPNASSSNGFPNGTGIQMLCQTITTLAGTPYPGALLDAAGLPTTSYMLAGKTLNAPAVAPTTVESFSCPVSATVTQALLPASVIQFLAPNIENVHSEDHSIFAQDQWRIKRLTLNLGARFDWFQGTNPAQTEPAQPQYGLPAKSFATQSNVADWKDLNPRLGVAYDLFGNGKTALKASLARAVLFEGISGITGLNNPVSELVSSTTRSWTDYSGTFNPVTDGANFSSPLASGGAGCVPATGANCALGPAANAGFYNQTNAANVTYANNTTHGWFNRPENWQMSVSVQQEVTRGVSLSFDYYRTWFGNLTVAQNTAIPTNGYDQYCVTPPASPAYSGVGGSPLCNLYDPQPQYVGKATYLVQKATAFSCGATSNAPGCGNASDIYTGIDVIANVRNFHGLTLQGGVSAGHEVTNYCVEVNSPQDLYYASNPSPVTSSILEFTNNNFSTVNDAAPCYINPPWYQNLQFKAAVVYTLPWWKIKLSANDQNLPSIPLQATYSYKCGSASACATAGVTFLPNSDAHTSLTGNPTDKVEVLTPQTIFPFGRNNQLDFRVAKDFTIRERWKIEPTVDFFNLLNASTILGINTAYNTNAPPTGSSVFPLGSWRNITQFLPARIVKFGVHVDF